MAMALAAAAVGGVALAPAAAHFRAIALIALLHGLLVGQAVTLAEVPAPRGVGARVVRIEASAAGAPGPTCRVLGAVAGAGPFVVDLPPETCPLAAGDVVRAVGLARVRGRFLPGAGPAAEAIAARAGGLALLRAAHAYREPGARGAADPVAVLRQRVAKRGAGGGPRAFVAAAVFGLRRGLDPLARDDLRRAGLGHLVAVSGLHVGLLSAMWVAVFLRIVPADRPAWAHGAALPLAVAFAVVTGAAAPAVRAAGTLAVTVVCAARGHLPHRASGVTAVGAAMALCRPGWVFDPAYQLSMAAALAIATAPPGGSVVRTTWRITWALAPLSFHHFGDAPLWGVATNLVAIPVFAGWVLPLGLVGALPGPVGAAAFDAAAWGAALLLDLARLFRAPGPLPLAVGVAVAALAWVVATWRRWPGLAPPSLAVAALGWLWLWPVAGEPPPRWIAYGRQRPQVVVYGPEGPCRGFAGDVSDPLRRVVLPGQHRADPLPACRAVGVSVPVTSATLRALVRRCGRGVRFVRRTRDGGIDCFRDGRFQPIGGGPGAPMPPEGRTVL